MSCCHPTVLSKHDLSHLSALDPVVRATLFPEAAMDTATHVAQDPQELPSTPWGQGVPGQQTFGELPFAGKLQYFALVGGKSWVVERAAWPKPSSANTDMIYFVADTLALFFPAPHSTMGPWLARLVLMATCWCAGLQPM